MDDQENGDDRRGIQSIDFVGKVLRALAAAQDRSTSRH